MISTAYLDEAERCTRLGLLHDGRMLYCDTPAALKSAMPGAMLAIASREARRARDVVAERDGVQGAMLMGDGVHVVVDDAARRASELEAALSAANIPVDEIERVAPAIEDVFVALLDGEAANDGARTATIRSSPTTSPSASAISPR